MGSPISPSSDGEKGNAAARNSFLRLFEDCLAAKSSVAVPVVVAIEITGVRRVRLVELADRTVMVDMVVVPVFRALVIILGRA